MAALFYMHDDGGLASASRDRNAVGGPSSLVLGRWLRPVGHRWFWRRGVRGWHADREIFGSGPRDAQRTGPGTGRGSARAPGTHRAGVPHGRGDAAADSAATGRGGVGCGGEPRARRQRAKAAGRGLEIRRAAIRPRCVAERGKSGAGEARDKGFDRHVERGADGVACQSDSHAGGRVGHPVENGDGERRVQSGFSERRTGEREERRA